MAANRPNLLSILVNASNVVGVVLIWVMAALMCIDVLSRNILSRPIPGVSDLVASAVVLIVFLQLASAVRNDRLTRADFLFSPLQSRSPLSGRVLSLVFNIIGIAVCIGIAYWTIPRLSNAWTRNEFVGNVGIMTFPRWPMPAVVLFGSVLAALQFLAKALHDITGTKDEPPDAASNFPSSGAEGA